MLQTFPQACASILRDQICLRNWPPIRASQRRVDKITPGTSWIANVCTCVWRSQRKDCLTVVEGVADTLGAWWSITRRCQQQQIKWTDYTAQAPESCWLSISVSVFMCVCFLLMSQWASHIQKSSEWLRHSTTGYSSIYLQVYGILLFQTGSTHSFKNVELTKIHTLNLLH